MQFAIKAEVRDPRARTFSFSAQKTMYGGKQIAEGATLFVFASENEGGHGLVARGVVTSAEAGRAGSELNFKFYRQATNKIVGISEQAAAYLGGFF